MRGSISRLTVPACLSKIASMLFPFSPNKILKANMSHFPLRTTQYPKCLELKDSCVRSIDRSVFASKRERHSNNFLLPGALPLLVGIEPHTLHFVNCATF